MSNAKRHRIICPAIFLTLLNFALFPELSNAQVDDQARKTAYEIFKQLIEIDTTDSAGNVTAAADAMHKRFVQAGFTQDDLFLGGPTEKRKILLFATEEPANISRYSSSATWTLWKRLRSTGARIRFS